MAFQRGNKVNLGRKRPDIIGNKFRCGIEPWNKNKKLPLHSLEHRLKQSLGIKNNLPQTAFVVGRIPWNKGKKCPQLSGENNSSWRGGITSFNKIERNKFRDTVMKSVFERDNYTCQICGKRGVELHIDHIRPWSEYIELRFDINNCRTLCRECHYKITFGKDFTFDIKSWGRNLTQMKGGY
jgi:5-methylcytosine-specific restriction endonuclease McrA